MNEQHIIREPEVMRRTGLSHSTIWRLRKLDRFAKPLRISTSAIGWLASDLDSWLAARLAERDAA